MKQNYFTEIFEYPISEFLTHLEHDYNERIIFSAKYGMGKTSFLSDFFSDDNQTKIFRASKYSVYTICPVNYSIASNEDILKYIKYDIILGMLEKSITFEKMKLRLVDTFPEYVQKHINKVMAALIYMIPKLGKEVVESFERLNELKEEYFKFHNEANLSNEDRLVEYMDRMEIKEGGLYESDITTKIISETIKPTRDQKTILLIDDIDRIDPEHVFRILNVFASHLTPNKISGEKNKFNFDKVIIVCDFNNIRHLFHHRYGKDADFMGYIDKFYSSDVYRFDNKKAIVSIITRFFDSIDFGKTGIYLSALRELYFNDHFLIGLTSLLIRKSLISLRNLSRLYQRKINYQDEDVTFPKPNAEVSAYNVPMIIKLKLLKDVFGDFDGMRNTFFANSLINETIENFQYYFGDFLYILSYNIHFFNPRELFVYTFQGTPIVIEAKIKHSNSKFEQAILYTLKEMTPEGPIRGKLFDVTPEMFWAALNDTIKFLNSIEYLK